MSGLLLIPPFADSVSKKIKIPTFFYAIMSVFLLIMAMSYFSVDFGAVLTPDDLTKTSIQDEGEIKATPL